MFESRGAGESPDPSVAFLEGSVYVNVFAGSHYNKPQDITCMMKKNQTRPIISLYI